MAPTLQNTKLLLIDEINTIFDRFKKQANVIGIIVYDPYGTPLRSTLTKSDTLNYIRMGTDLVSKAQRGNKDLDLEDESVEMIRVRTGTREVFIAPDRLFTLLVVQATSCLDESGGSQGDAGETCGDYNQESAGDVTRDADDEEFMTSSDLFPAEGDGSFTSTVTFPLEDEDGAREAQ